MGNWWLGKQIVSAVLAFTVDPCQGSDGPGLRGGSGIESQLCAGVLSFPSEREYVAISLVRKLAVKSRKSIAECAQCIEGLNYRALKVLFNFLCRVVVTVDVTTNVGAFEQLHVICARESAHVVDLGDPG